jgi:hypothetical protein
MLHSFGPVSSSSSSALRFFPPNIRLLKNISHKNQLISVKPFFGANDVAFAVVLGFDVGFVVVDVVAVVVAVVVVVVVVFFAPFGAIQSGNVLAPLSPPTSNDAIVKLMLLDANQSRKIKKLQNYVLRVIQLFLFPV